MAVPEGAVFSTQEYLSYLFSGMINRWFVGDKTEWNPSINLEQ